MLNRKNSNYLVIFDLDGTLTTHRSSWQFVLEKIGKWETIGKQNLENFVTGKIRGNTKEDQYLEFCRRDAEALKGIKYIDFVEIINEIPFRSNINPMIDFFHNQLNAYICIISAGFIELAQRAQSLFSIDKIIANQLKTSNGSLNGGYDIKVSWHGKQAVLQSLKKEIPVEKNKILSFGDTSGDLELFKESGINFACFEASPDVIKQANFHITDFKDVPKIITNRYNLS